MFNFFNWQPYARKREKFGECGVESGVVREGNCL